MALADIARVVEGTDVRVIGGHMVQLHVYRWGLGPELYRETRDADLGVPSLALKSPDLIERLRGLGYKPLSGNRFGRVVDDLAVQGLSEEDRMAIVDVLVPAYRTRPRQDVRFGDHLRTIEVPGLAGASCGPPWTSASGSSA